MADDGMSFSDLLSELLGDWPKFGKFVLLLLSVCGLVLGLSLGISFAVFNTIPQEASEVRLEVGDTKASILLTQSKKQGDREYLVVVHPQGWQETGIPVEQGDALSFEAGGKVYIDLEGLNLSLDARHKAEVRIIDEETKAGRWQKEKIAPELHYTPEESQNTRPPWRWIDAEGMPESDMAVANPARRKRAIMPSKGYGALLGAIRETGVLWPSRTDSFFVGSRSSTVAKVGGKLYFTVNDIWDEGSDFPDKFFVDNVGFYYVKVTVTSQKQKTRK